MLRIFKQGGRVIWIQHDNIVEQKRHEFAQKMINDDNDVDKSSGNRCGSREVAGDHGPPR